MGITFVWVITNNFILYWHIIVILFLPNNLDTHLDISVEIPRHVLAFVLSEWKYFNIPQVLLNTCLQGPHSPYTAVHFKFIEILSGRILMRLKWFLTGTRVKDRCLWFKHLPITTVHCGCPRQVLPKNKRKHFIYWPLFSNIAVW